MQIQVFIISNTVSEASTGHTRSWQLSPWFKEQDLIKETKQILSSGVQEESKEGDVDALTEENIQNLIQKLQGEEKSAKSISKNETLDGPAVPEGTAKVYDLVTRVLLKQKQLNDPKRDVVNKKIQVTNYLMVGNEFKRISDQHYHREISDWNAPGSRGAQSHGEFMPDIGMDENGRNMMPSIQVVQYRFLNQDFLAEKNIE